MQHHPHISHNATIISLSHPITLWVVGCCELSSKPYFTHKFLNSFDTHSPPLLLLRAFTFLLVSFSTSALNSTNLENVSSFFCMKKIQHFCEKSSIKMTKYLCLVVEAVEKSPHTLEWIHSNTAFAFLSLSWNVYFMYYPNVHPLHTSGCSSAPSWRIVVIFYITFRAPRCK